MNKYPFWVPVHEFMIATLPGKVPGTVLTVEKQLYSVRICEYHEPLFYKRFWCYAHEAEAIAALAFYVASENDLEPGGWVRAGELTPTGSWVRSRPAREDARG